MRTKTLLSVAAAIAAGACFAQAQVYSVNIVGYVNQTLPGGALALAQNPLDDGTNDLGSAYGALANGSVAYVWNGSAYDIANKQKAGWSPNLGVPTGLGLFVQASAAITNTYVGETVGAPGENVTNSLGNGILALTGSLLPYAGALSDTNLGLGSAPNGSVLYKWNGASYDIANKQKAGWSPDLTIGVAEGFFIQPAADYDWVQSLPAN